MQLQLTNTFSRRPVRFQELFCCDGWTIKLYIMSVHPEFNAAESIAAAKAALPLWLKNAANYPLAHFKIATLLLHECREGVFAITSWWIDENMLQVHVYLDAAGKAAGFNLFSDRGIVTCVWEMAVLWFERNAWVEHVLLKPATPDFDAYLAQQLNGEV